MARVPFSVDDLGRYKFRGMWVLAGGREQVGWWGVGDVRRGVGDGY